MQTVIVSGGSRGLGAAITDRLLSCGHRVGTFGRTSSESVASLQAKPQYRDRFYFSEVDVTDTGAVVDFVKSVVDRFGGVDVLINNAGVAPSGLLAMASLESIDQAIAINLKGALVLTRACLRPMLRARGGAIINISSMIGLRGYAGLTTYSATKAGLDATTRSLAREVGSRGIRVNSIAPGYLDTEMTDELSEKQRQQIIRRTPLGRLGTSADVLPVIDFLMSKGSGFITGQTFVVDGGISV